MEFLVASVTRDGLSHEELLNFLLTQGLRGEIVCRNVMDFVSLHREI